MTLYRLLQTLALRRTWRFPGLLLLLALILGGAVGCHVQPKLQVEAQDTAMDLRKKVPIVTATGYAANGKMVLTGGVDHDVHLWDLEAMKEVRKLKGHTGTIRGLAFLADGRTVISTSTDGSLRRWDLASGRETGNIPNFYNGMLGISVGVPVSPDGHFALGATTSLWSNAWTVDLYDLRTGAVLQRFPGKFGALSPDGNSVLVLHNEVQLLDRDSGRMRWQCRLGDRKTIFWGLAVFSQDGRTIVVMDQEMASSFAPRVTTFHLIDARSGQLIKTFGRQEFAGNPMSMAKIMSQINCIGLSPDGTRLVSGDMAGNYKVWDIAADRMVCQLKVADEISGTILNVVPSVAFAPDGRTLVAATLGAARYFDAASGAELASLVSFEDGEWLFMTPGGYYNASEKGDQYLDVAVKGQRYSIAQLRESFFRPDMIKLALAGGDLKEYRKVEDLHPPPTVSIVDTPATVATQELAVTLRIKDGGGGIGDVRLYLNGSAVVLDHPRGLAVVPAEAAGASIRKYTVKLAKGRNAIRAIAFNEDNSMQSNDAVQEVSASYAATGKPSLHAVVVGINEFKNPKLQLRFAVADAELFAATLKEGAATLFDQVIVHQLLTPAETTRENITRTLKAMQTLNPEDLFVFYVASHGTVDDGEYFLITSEVGSTSTAKLKTDALSQNLLKELIANIPATKKLIVIDTCGAGKLGDAIQVAMLTRGMSEDTAIKVLSRAVGSTILAASTSLQEALEGYEGHGLFTYVLTEGMKGKADSHRDGFVKTIELASYVDDEVPKLAEQVFNRAQYPTVSPSGMGFPICKSK